MLASALAFYDSKLVLPASQNRRIWSRESWDRFIRDQAHFDATVRHIENNPVTAGLVSQPEHWPWSSASAGE